MGVGLGAEEEMRALAAKVSARADVEGGCAGFAAREEALVKGFEGVDEEVEKGFAGAVDDEDVEKGLEEVEGAVVGDLTPNSASPIFDCCGLFSAGGDCWSSAGFVLLFHSVSFSLATLVALMPLTLPSFLRHVLLLQLKMYSRRSCPGKCSGRSPLSCNSKLIRSLQTLHFASEPERAVVPSSHVCSYTISHRLKIAFGMFGHTGCPPSWLIVSPVGSLEA